MEIVYLLIGFISGILFVALASFICSTRGILRIDHSDPNKELYRFEFNKIEDLNHATRVVLTVDHHADLSQK